MRFPPAPAFQPPIPSVGSEACNHSHISFTHLIARLLQLRIRSRPVFHWLDRHGILCDIGTASNASVPLSMNSQTCCISYPVKEPQSRRIRTGDEAVEYCVHHSETTAIFVHTKNWAALSKSFPKFKDQVHTIIYWGPEAVNREVFHHPPSPLPLTFSP